MTVVRASTAAASLLLVALVVSAALAPLLAPHDPTAIAVMERFLPPSAQHPFGTDELGRDLFSRALYAGRVSFSVGLVAVGISVTIGVFVGALAGTFGGWVDRLAMRFVDLMLCFPTFFLILAVIAFLEPSLFNIMGVIGVTSWMGAARLVRAEFLRLRTVEFVAAARVGGASPWRVALLNMLPNALPPVLVHATLGIADAVLVESGLSFLGLGVQPPTPSWGNMLLSGKDTLVFAWWQATFPGLLILFTALSLTVVGQALQDRFDPRHRERQA